MEQVCEDLCVEEKEQAQRQREIVSKALVRADTVELAVMTAVTVR